MLQRRLVFFLQLTIYFLFILFLARLALKINFAGDFASVPTPDLWYAFYLGSKFDLRIICLGLLPLFFLSFIPFTNPFKNEKAKFFTLLYTIFLFFTLVFTHIVDFFYYQYLHSRISVALFKFSENPDISLQMVWQTYPIIRLLFLIIILLLLHFWLMNQWLLKKEFASPPSSKKKSIIQNVLLFLLLCAGVYGKAALYPLRWSEAFFSVEPNLGHLAINPIQYFWDTMQFKVQTYDIGEVKKYYPLISKYLRVDQPDEQNLSFDRSFSSSQTERKSNVVIILLESVSAMRTAHFGNKLNPTPHFDQLMDQSLFFDRFYVPTIATARSVFAAVTSLPDISLVKSSSRNPLIIDQHTAFNTLVGYEKFYFLGGNSNWGNIRSLFTHNIKDVHIMDDEKLHGKRLDVWGVNDYEMFEQVHETLMDCHKKSPCFIFAQTSGYHRPYTVPENHVTYKPQPQAEEDIKKYGFLSYAEYNSLRFQDHALGHLLELARKEDYYKDTIFLLLGDHGLPHNGGINVSEADKAFSFANYQVPFVIHAAFLKPEKISKIASELDIVPTIMGLLGKSYFTRGLGRDLLNPQYDSDRAAFIYEWYNTPASLGLVSEKFYFQHASDGSDHLFEYPASTVKEVSTQYPKEFEYYKNLTLGLHESTRYLLYHNTHKD